MFAPMAGCAQPPIARIAYKICGDHETVGEKNSTTKRLGKKKYENFRRTYLIVHFFEYERARADRSNGCDRAKATKCRDKKSSINCTRKKKL